jgi:hypothetical protein
VLRVGIQTVGWEVEVAQDLEGGGEAGRSVVHRVRPGRQQEPGLLKVAGERVLAHEGPLPVVVGRADGGCVQVGEGDRRLGRPAALPPQAGAGVEPVVAEQPVAVGGDQIDASMR